jgi:hypothetical protein
LTLQFPKRALNNNKYTDDDMARNPIVKPTAGCFVEICEEFDPLPYEFLKEDYVKPPKHRYIRNIGYRENVIMNRPRKVLSITTNCATTSDRLLYLTADKPKAIAVRKKYRYEDEKVIITDTYESRPVGIVQSVDVDKRIAHVRLMKEGGKEDVIEDFPFGVLRVISRNEMRKIFKQNYVEKNVNSLHKAIQEGTKLARRLQDRTDKETAMQLNSPTVNVYGKALYGIVSARSARSTKSQLSTPVGSMRTMRKHTYSTPLMTSRNFGSTLYEQRGTLKNFLLAQYADRSTAMEKEYERSDELDMHINYRGVVEQVYFNNVKTVKEAMDFNVYLVVNTTVSQQPVVTSSIDTPISVSRTTTPSVSRSTLNTPNPLLTYSQTSSMLPKVENKQVTVKVKLDFLSFMSADMYTQVRNSFINLREIAQKVYQNCMRELEDVLLDKAVIFYKTVEHSDSDGFIYVNMFLDPYQTFQKQSGESDWIQGILVNRGIAGVNVDSTVLSDEEYEELIDYQKTAQDHKKGMWRHHNEYVGVSPSRRRAQTHNVRRSRTSLADYGLAATDTSEMAALFTSKRPWSVNDSHNSTSSSTSKDGS